MKTALQPALLCIQPEIHSWDRSTNKPSVQVYKPTDHPTCKQDKERAESSLISESAAIQPTTCPDFAECFAGAIGEVNFQERFGGVRYTTNLIGNSLHTELGKAGDA